MKDFEDSDQIFSYILHFLITLRTQLFCKTFFVAACEFGKKTHDRLIEITYQIQKSNINVLNTFLCFYIF